MKHNNYNKTSVIPQVINNIICLRNQRGYSQEYMAQEMHMTTQSYSNIERQVTKLSAIHIERIAQILNVEPGMLWSFHQTQQNEYIYQMFQSLQLDISNIYPELNQIKQFMQQMATKINILITNKQNNHGSTKPQ